MKHSCPSFCSLVLLLLSCQTTAFTTRSARQGLSESSRKLSSCPVFDFPTQPFNATIAVSQPATSSQQATTTPKVLGRVSALKFTVASLMGKPHHYLAHLQRKHGENFIIWPNIVVLNNPQAIRDVLETHNLPKTPKVRFGYKSIFYGATRRSSGGILAAPWNKWLQQRRMATPALSITLDTKIQKASEPFFSHLEDMATQGQPVDMSAAFTAVTMDVIGTILLGKSFGMCHRLHLEEKEVPFASALHRLTDEAVQQMVLPAWCLKRRPKSQNVEGARMVIDEFLEDCIATRIAEPKDDTTDLLNILIDAERNGVMSHEEVKGQLLQFVFAGFDTLAPTLTYMLWEITQNSSLQSELESEAQSALANLEDFPEELNALPKRLPLLDRTFSETLRKHPAAAMGTSRNVGRKALVVGDNIQLPKQSTVLISPWTLHRNERLWEDPETFDPQRFLGKKQEPFSYQPFSGGPRNCIGIRLARVETLALFAPLLRRYNIQSTTRRPPDDHFSLTRRPKQPVTFKLTPKLE